MNTHIHQLSGQFGHELVAALVNLGSAIGTQLDRFSAFPDADFTQDAARNLEVAARACTRLIEQLLRVKAPSHAT